MRLTLTFNLFLKIQMLNKWGLNVKVDKDCQSSIINYQFL